MKEKTFYLTGTYDGVFVTQFERAKDRTEAISQSGLIVQSCIQV